MAATVKAQSGDAGRKGWRLLATRDFGFLWSGQAISQIGDGLNKIALLWFVYELTGSALKMGLIGLLQTVPPLVLGPLIGVYLDRLPRKAVMIWVDLVRTVLVLLIPVLYAFDVLTLERLYGLVFLIAIFSTVFGPALSSSVPLIVSRSELTAANALLQSTTNLGVLIGPALSGVGIALIGAQNVLYVNAGTFFVSALCLIPIRVRSISVPRRDAASSRTLFREMTEGFRFVFVNRLILALMGAASLYALASSAFVYMLPVFAKQLFHVGPVQLGWLWSALGVGMLLSSAWLAWSHQGEASQRLRLIAAAQLIGAVSIAALSLVDHPLVTAAFMIAIGGSTAVFTPVAWSMLQEMTPTHMLARVMTTFSTGGMFAAMMGMLVFGWAADTMGPVACLIGIGLILAGAAALAARLSRHVDVSEATVADPLPAA